MNHHVHFADNTSTHSSPRAGALARRRPLTMFVLLAFGLGWPALSIPLVADVPTEPFLLLLSYVGLFGSAVLVTRLAGGPGSIRSLTSRLLMWRFSPGRWAVILLGVPTLTVALAAVSGTLDLRADGWDDAVIGYLLGTVTLAALVNLWEETGWGGFTQSRLMARHGLLKSALMTAPLFAAIHLPMQFWGDPTASEVLVSIAVLFGAAPFYRYLLGMHLMDTGGSILAIAVQHASWNAAGGLDGVDGWWQAPGAVVLLTGLLALSRRGRRRISLTSDGPQTDDGSRLNGSTPVVASYDGSVVVFPTDAASSPRSPATAATPLTGPSPLRGTEAASGQR